MSDISSYCSTVFPLIVDSNVGWALSPISPEISPSDSTLVPSPVDSNVEWVFSPLCCEISSADSPTLPSNDCVWLIPDDTLDWISYLSHYKDVSDFLAYLQYEYLTSLWVVVFQTTSDVSNKSGHTTSEDIPRLILSPQLAFIINTYILT